jgi:hypothetical protein
MSSQPIVQLGLALPAAAFVVSATAVFYLRVVPVAMGDSPCAWRYVTPNGIAAIVSLVAASSIYAQPYVSPSPYETGLWICWVGFQILVVYFSTGLMPEIRRRGVEAAARQSDRVSIEDAERET